MCIQCKGSWHGKCATVAGVEEVLEEGAEQPAGAEDGRHLHHARGPARALSPRGLTLDRIRLGRPEGLPT
jgi:hypothetical protein